jgi:hypothetical protein
MKRNYLNFWKKPQTEKVGNREKIGPSFGKLEGTSINCRERFECEADGTEKPECIPTSREGFRVPPNDNNQIE